MTADSIRLIVDILAIAVVGIGFIKGGLAVQRDLQKYKDIQAQHSEWIKAHEICNQKQIAILTELREDIAYIKGKLDVDN
jgi:hypothetical protein